MGWLIFAGIVLLLTALLMIPVHVRAEWKETLSVEIRYLFLKFKLYPAEKKEKKKKKSSGKAETASKAKHPKKKEKKLPEEVVDGIIDAINRYGPGAKMILKNVRLHTLEGFWKIAADDAAECAIRYGKICAYLNTALGFFRNLMKIEKTKLRVYPDFTAEKEEIWVKLDGEANPLILLIGFLRVGAVFLKDSFRKAKRKNKYTAAEKMPQNS